jgi:hypothetical protein
MDDTVVRIHPKEKFLFICGSMKLENKVFASKIQWWDKLGITFVDTPILKRRKWKEGITGSKQFQNPATQIPLGFKDKE